MSFATLFSRHPRHWGIVLINVAVLAGVIGSADAAPIQRDATVRAGSELQLTVTGFAPYAQTQLRIACLSARLERPQADRNGRVRVQLQVPRTLAQGSHLLFVVGAAPATARDRSATGNIAVTVPKIAQVRFRVADEGAGSSREPGCEQPH